LRLSNLWDIKLAMQMLNNGLPYEEESLQAICRALLGWRLDEVHWLRTAGRDQAFSQTTGLCFKS